jgi:hypothetical protein
MRNASCAALLFLVLIHGGCRTGKEITGEQKADGSFVLAGRMEFVNIETGCWVLVANDGRRFEPAGEQATLLLKDGLRVTVRVTALAGVASVCQTGPIVQVEEILDTQEP